jgi:cell division protein FtsB
MGAISLKAARRRERLKRVLARLALGGLILLILGIVYLFISRAVAIKRLEAELARLARLEKELLQERRALEGLYAKRFDNEYMEYLARKELGLIAPGEEKYIILGLEEVPQER